MDLRRKHDEGEPPLIEHVLRVEDEAVSGANNAGDTRDRGHTGMFVRR
jgi:hypothetical protein